MPLRENLPSGASPFPPRMAFRYCRMERVAPGPAHPLSGPPMTWTLCEQRHEFDRTIYYVRLDTWRVDGLSGALARQRYRNSVLVDARTLGPLTNRLPAPNELTYISQWRAYYRKTWRQMLERDKPCELLARRFWERPIFARQAMLRSETGIKWLRRPNVEYVGETVCHPTVPNDVHARQLGDGTREVIAYAAICPTVQADAGLDRWCQRVWYLDHGLAKFYGVDALDDYAVCVDASTPTHGIYSTPFDPRNLRAQSVFDLGQLAGPRDQFLGDAHEH